MLTFHQITVNLAHTSRRKVSHIRCLKTYICIVIVRALEWVVNPKHITRLARHIIMKTHFLNERARARVLAYGPLYTICKYSEDLIRCARELMFRAGSIGVYDMRRKGCLCV